MADTNALSEHTKKAEGRNLSELEAKDSQKVYRDAVVRLIREKTDKEIANGLPLHAAIIFEQFFLNAQEKVRVFCRNLSEDVFSTPFVLEAAQAALDKGVYVEIISQEDISSSNPFRALLAKFPEKALFRIATENFAKSKVNFAVMDKRAYRLEPDRDECVATANMHEPAVAEMFAETFDGIK